MRFFIAVCLFCLGVGNAAAHTFLLDMRIDSPPEDLGLEQRLILNAWETGIMDTLFNKGHIFFNTYTLPSDTEDPDNIHDQAVDTDADFLVRLVPDDAEAALHWTLFSVEPATQLAAGQALTEGLPDQRTVIDRWYTAGVLAAEKILAKLSPSNTSHPNGR